MHFTIPQKSETRQCNAFMKYSQSILPDLSGGEIDAFIGISGSQKHNELLPALGSGSV